MSKKLIFTTAGALLAAMAFYAPASALTMKECSVKYKAAQADGSAKDIKWNDFRAKFCGATAAATPATVDEPTDKTATDAEPAKPTMTAPKGVNFPTAVDAKYSSQTPGKARMHTCVDAYHANKAANTLNGLKWIQKGGGFYSLCNAKLKGTS
jgi:hypothetical protein